MRLAFFDGDSLIGVGFISEPMSTHYFCPTCGQIWGREIVLDDDSQHHVTHIPCREHIGPLQFLPIFSEHSPRFWVRTVPNEVLVRDFLLLCELNDQQ